MKISAMHINELKPIDVPVSGGWVVSQNKIYNLSPEDVDRVTGLEDDVTAWDYFFVQDMFQAIRSSESRLVDVGWYPDGDPEGRFRLVVVGKNTIDGEFDWGKPDVSFETRSLDQLLDKLREALHNPH